MQLPTLCWMPGLRTSSIKVGQFLPVLCLCSLRLILRIVWHYSCMYAFGLSKLSAAHQTSEMASRLQYDSNHRYLSFSMMPIIKDQLQFMGLPAACLPLPLCQL